ncbi:hypothetical protein [Craurococcus roseus]|uniref:hypothetical protein n=1 Tax=Craurococcus roseus TaxID=77585 RepID=UPI0031DF93EF
MVWPIKSAPFDYAATAGAPPERLGVFGAWTATRTARVEGERFNCQADTGPLDPPPPGAHPWARARLAVYEFPGWDGAGVAAFWVRRMLPPDTGAVLQAAGERVMLGPSGGPVRMAQDPSALLALLERAAAAASDAVVTVTAPSGPSEADAEERFSLLGFREAVAAIRRECERPERSPDWLVLDGGLVRFGTGWNVHAVPTETPGRRTCFAAARRLLERGGPDPAGPRLVVARAMAPGGSALVSYDPAHVYAEGAVAILQVGDRRFPMPVRDGIAQALDGKAVVGAMLEADPEGAVAVTGPGEAGGAQATTRFSLDGFRWTYEAAATYCG